MVSPYIVWNVLITLILAPIWFQIRQNAYVLMNTNEQRGTLHGIDFLSNGFKVRSNSNNFNASSTIMYMAWAEHPFVTSKGAPGTAI